MFGFGKKQFKEGDYIFASVNEGNYSTIIIGNVTFAQMDKLKVSGIYIKPIGLIERLEQGRITARQQEVLRSPTPDNVIHVLINKVEYGIYNDYIQNNRAWITKISAKRYAEIETWVRDGYPELFSILLSPMDPRKDEAREAFMAKYNSLYDADFKQTLSAVARQLGIL